ncbi:MAG: arginine--tRNA ligase [Mycobacteriales bacterium]
MSPDQISAAVRDAVASAVAEGELVVEVPAQVRVERPRFKEHGDYSTNVALALAGAAGRSAREVAAVLASHLRAVPGICEVDVAGPGFLNLRLEGAAMGEIARAVVAQGASYGTNERLSGQRLNLEFVSANPTGPVHIGAVRWAAVGDALGRLLSACGAEVAREYYFNDAGSQIEHFAASLDAAARGEQVPESGYAGEYVAEIAQQVLAEHPDLLQAPREQSVATFRARGVAFMLAAIQQSLADFGVEFDVYFSERELHETGAVQAAIQRLREQGHLYEADGALWLRTTDFGDDKDRVLVRSGGEPTYFASDAAYYLHKRARGFDRVLIMLGADHHGYVNRLRAMAACFGDDPDAHLEVLIGQLVSLVRAGEVVRMSKRAGNVVTLEDLVEAVGVDAARYSLARSATDSPLTLDLDLISRAVSENPVFYVQYAHARIASLLRRAEEDGVRRGEDFHPGLLSHPRENDLLAALGEFPRVVAGAAELREAHRVARYLEELAGIYHRFYDACRVLPLGDDAATDVNRARLWLCEATRVVLCNGLALLGVSAPERM